MKTTITALLTFAITIAAICFNGDLVTIGAQLTAANWIVSIGIYLTWITCITIITIQSKNVLKTCKQISIFILTLVMLLCMTAIASTFGVWGTMANIISIVLMSPISSFLHVANTPFGRVAITLIAYLFLLVITWSINYVLKLSKM